MKKEELEKTASTSTEMEVHKGNGNFIMVPLDPNDMDQLESADKAPIDLMGNYWTPENIGEFKRVIFDRIDASKVLAQDTGEIIELECAFFLVKENGVVKQVLNGSKRLVGALQSYNIVKGTPLEIKYLGKKTNSTNSFKSDNWSVTPLIVKPKA